MAVAEGPALDVLSAQAHVDTFLEQSAEGQRLGRCPVEANASVEHVLLVLHDSRESAMDVKVFRVRRQALADISQLLQRDSSVLTSREAESRLESLPAVLQGDFTLIPSSTLNISPRLLESLFEDSHAVRLHLVNLVLGQKGLLQRLVLEFLQHGLRLGNVLIHQRLCEARLVNLIVTVSPVPNNVHNHIFAKLLSELSCSCTNPANCL
mmetsp:Transcript_44400/g.140113  ORF Transcript_44400/g.140113 Transcript_44400/m.140113 type:complete len:209 (+) Transcript_44400:1094-1720(+)